MTFNVIATGSKGNAVLIDDYILIDCGVSYRTLKPYLDEGKIKRILITHWHGDHFRESTAKMIGKMHPGVVFLGAPWMLEKFTASGVSNFLIPPNKNAHLGGYTIFWERVPHDVPNCCYHIAHGNERCFYCTDVGDLSDISAKGYDYYLIEANHTVAEIEERIREKQAKGEYAYEYRASANHLSREQADKWIAENADWQKSRVLYLHQHRQEG